MRVNSRKTLDKIKATSAQTKTADGENKESDGNATSAGTGNVAASPTKASPTKRKNKAMDDDGAVSSKKPKTPRKKAAKMEDNQLPAFKPEDEA
jgi:hypothetical protein